eukprot:PhM_4_TR8773/c3_g2_i2/m.88947
MFSCRGCADFRCTAAWTLIGISRGSDAEVLEWFRRHRLVYQKVECDNRRHAPEMPCRLKGNKWECTSRGGRGGEARCQRSLPVDGPFFHNHKPCAKVPHSAWCARSAVPALHWWVDAVDDKS